MMKRYSLPLRYILTVLMIFAAARAGAVGHDTPDNRPYADLKRIHYGFAVGLHFQDLKFTHNGIAGPDGGERYASVADPSPGFCVNVLADLRLHRYLNLRLSPGIYFGSKNVTMLNRATMEEERQSVKSAYVVVPLELKISGERMRNVRPYVTAGAMEAFDIGKKRSAPLMFNTADTYLTVGLGCDFYLPFFKLNPEIKFCFGLTDVLRHSRPDLDDDPAGMSMTAGLKKVKSNMVVISFYFE